MKYIFFQYRALSWKEIQEIPLIIFFILFSKISTIRNIVINVVFLIG